jgi:hypothetical protein
VHQAGRSSRAQPQAEQSSASSGIVCTVLVGVPISTLGGIRVRAERRAWMPPSFAAGSRRGVHLLVWERYRRRRVGGERLGRRFTRPPPPEVLWATSPGVARTHTRSSARVDACSALPRRRGGRGGRPLRATRRRRNEGAILPGVLWPVKPRWTGRHLAPRRCPRGVPPGSGFGPAPARRWQTSALVTLNPSGSLGYRRGSAAFSQELRAATRGCGPNAEPVAWRAKLRDFDSPPSRLRLRLA